MIDICELQIGDWIYFKAETPKPCKVVSLEGGWGDMLIRQSLTNTFYSDACFDPIPITPQILLDWGFKEIGTMKELGKCSDREFVYNDERGRRLVYVVFFGNRKGTEIMIKIETRNAQKDGVNYMHNCDMKYVHQLQHALCLNGLCNIAYNLNLQKV